MSKKATPLAILMEERKITQKSLAEYLGVTRQAVQRWQSGQPMRMETLKRLSEYFDVSVAYLAGEINEALPQGAVLPAAFDSEPIEGFTKIPIYNADAGCSPDINSQVTEFIAGYVFFADWFLHSLPGITSIQHLSIVPSSGDSMEPTIASRSLLLVDQNQNRITRDGIFCIRAVDQILVKRVERNIDGTFTLLSDNPLYPPINVPRDDMDRTEIIGRVVFVLNGRSLP